MSNRRRMPATNPGSMLVRSMDGARIPGGCDHCNAYQTITADRYGPNLHGVGGGGIEVRSEPGQGADRKVLWPG